MITKIAIMTSFLSTILMMKAQNPLKTSFFILISTMGMFMILFQETGSAWVPSLMVMLFTGGILMMFMMLSAMLPNIKSMKMKVKKSSIIYVFIIAFLASTTQTLSQDSLGQQIKSFISSGMLFMFMSMVILIYFLMSMEMASAEEYSMRSLMC